MKKTFVVWFNPTEGHRFVDASNAEEIRDNLKNSHGPDTAANAVIFPHITNDQAARRYPNLVQLCKRAAILCDIEAAHCIAMFKMGFPYGGEAVNNFGGPQAVVQHAVSTRQYKPVHI